MRKVGVVENVSRLDILDSFVLMGIDTSAKKGKMVSHGNTIVKYVAGDVIGFFKQKYFYFISYREGILYYEKEGDPIFFTDFKLKKQLTDKKHYFNPLQKRRNRNTVLITEVDDLFNKSYYLLTEQTEKKLLPKFSSLLLTNSFICTSKNTVELFSTITMEMCWIYQRDESLPFDKRNKIFSDEDLVYVPLKGGALKALDVLTGTEKWKWQGDVEYVSYGEIGDFVYVHAGDKIIIVSKINGQIENIINYSDYDKLDSFRSNGIIWCFDKLIVVRNSGNGEIVLFSRETFELLGREIVDKSGIGESKDRIQLLGNYLYILGTSSIAHIYNLNKASTT